MKRGNKVKAIQAFVKEQPLSGPSRIPLEVKQLKGKGSKKKKLGLRLKIGDYV